MATSQNGWPAFNSTANFVRGEAAGFKFWAANDDVRVIFEDLVGWFNRVVEPVAGKILDDWSWANRNVRGSDTTVSNHASATALDLNALKHPRGVRNTFTAKQRAAIDERMKYYEGVIRCGKDYRTTVDDMHFEINKGKADTKRVADKIRASALKAVEDDLNLTKENLEDIANAVLNLRTIPNRNAPAGSTKPNWTLREMVSNLEDTQDVNTATLNSILINLEKIQEILKSR